MEPTKVDQIIRAYDSCPASLVMILQDLNRIYDSLPASALRQVAQYLEVDPHFVEDAAMFFRQYGPEQLSRALTTFSIDEEICKGCGLCRRKCPVQAVTGVQKGRHVIDEDKCLHCGLCRDKCRLGSILTIWHTDREFVHCDVCGQPLATSNELELVRAILPTDSTLAPICPVCRRAKWPSVGPRPWPAC